MELKYVLQEEEIWKPIPGVPFYEASNQCRIRSIDRMVNHNYGGSAIKRGRIISQYVDNSGYMSCGVSVNGKMKTVKAHRLIAMAWIPNPENKPTVNHIWGNKHDNRPCQLEWATHLEQVRHAWAIGLNGNFERSELQKTSRIEAQKRPVVSKDCTTGIETPFESISECAASLKVTQSCVSYSLIRGNKIQRRYKVQYANLLPTNRAVEK